MKKFSEEWMKRGKYWTLFGKGIIDGLDMFWDDVLWNEGNEDRMSCKPTTGFMDQIFNNIMVVMLHSNGQLRTERDGEREKECKKNPALQQKTTGWTELTTRGIAASVPKASATLCPNETGLSVLRHPPPKNIGTLYAQMVWLKATKFGTVKHVGYRSAFIGGQPRPVRRERGPPPPSAKFVGTLDAHGTKNNNRILHGDPTTCEECWHMIWLR